MPQPPPPPPQQQRRMLQQQQPQPPPPPTVRRYTYYDSNEIYNKLLEFQDKYSEFVTLTTAQELYNLPRAGTNDDCPYEQQQHQNNNNNNNNGGCSNWIVIIEDPISNPPPNSVYAEEDIVNADGFTKYEALPEVFLTAALHGNDHIGPTVLIETMELMLEAAWCESLPRTERRNDNNEEFDSSSSPITASEEEEEDLEEARQCREELVSKGIYGRYRRWLSRLVTTRRIVIVPVANALGYYRNTPFEGGNNNNDDDAILDPNFDFPYDIQNNNNGNNNQQQGQCMSTIAARTINEIFRQHMFQSGISFHTSFDNTKNNDKEVDEGVYYEWGASSYEGYSAPDEFSMREISEALSGYGGEVMEMGQGGGRDSYPVVGPINNLLESNAGRMEDWAYAGSWDGENIGTCNPTSNGGYSESQTKYDASTLRSFHTLVESRSASSTNFEDEAKLGTTADLFTPYGTGNGHISRNIRLSLSMIDLVEPYVKVLGVDGFDIRDDVIPLMPRTEHNCRRTKVMKIPEKSRRNGNVTIAWTVGGSFTVDSTAIMYGKWSDLDLGGFFDCMSQPTKEELDVYFDNLQQAKNGPMAIESTVRFSEPRSGITRWHKNVPYPPPDSEFLTPSEAVFEVDLDLSRFKQGDSIAVYAVARVDQGWKTRSNNVYKNLHPQSHIVNARTNPDWFHEREGKVIQGRTDWFSIPLTIEIGHPMSSTMEKSVRSPDEEWEKDHVDYDRMLIWRKIKITFYAVFFVTMIVVCFFCREESDGTDVCSVWREYRKIEKATTVQIDELYDDEDGGDGWFDCFKFGGTKMEGQGGGGFEMADQTVT
uniref:Peptidase M14 domain-containing protein n=1 Tax=Ditylum brightwellii TaxID=49249 RepID=A0A7S2E557_9STRA|mmetsp:Transcript_13272/g.19818  ORF Transcript_13272/g.19818 Transcript_13272/m.19818 type:complete len:822 (+) Transcript_13272:73-2538(+)